MALPERVTPEQAAVVFRRAAELQAAGLHGGNEAVLDDVALEEIGREVGLSPASVQAALAELRSGIAPLQPGVRWGTVVRCRTIHGDRQRAVLFLDDQARQNMFTMAHREGDTASWAPDSGAAAAVVRGLRGRGRYPLLTLKELRADVTDVGNDVVRVCLEGTLRVPWRLLPLRSEAFALAGMGAGLFVAFGVGGAGSADWMLDATGALISITGAGVALHAYRGEVANAELALDNVLDRLTYATSGRTPWPLPPKPRSRAGRLTR